MPNDGAITIENLEIEISSESTSATTEIDRVANALSTLKSTTKGGITGLRTVAKQITALNAAISAMPDLTKIEQLRDILAQIKGLGRINISAAVDSPSTSDIGDIKGAGKEYSQSTTEEGVIEDALSSASQKAYGLQDFLAEAQQELASYGETATSVLEENISCLEDVREEVAAIKKESKSDDSNSIFNKIKKVANAVKSNVKSIFKTFTHRVLYRTMNYIISTIVNGLKEGISNLYQFSKALDGEFAKSLDNVTSSLKYFKNSIAALLASAIEAWSPVLVTLTDSLATFNNELSKLFAVMNGQSTYYKATKSAEEYAEAVNKAKSAVMGFDELNTLSSGTSYSDMFEIADTAVDFSSTAGQVKKWVLKIGTIVAGASLALGAILTLTGHAGIGIPLLISGASELVSAAAVNWDYGSDEIKRTVGTIMTTLGTAELVIGAFLTFSGTKVPLGLGLMASGAVSLASGVAINWDYMTGTVQGVVATIMGIFGGALLAIGGIIAFSGAGIPIGIGCMIAGASLLASAVAVNWSSMSDEVKNTLSIIMAAVGAASLVIGVILCLTGVGIPIGVGLILASCGSFAAAVAINWDAIVEWFQGAWDKVKNFFTNDVLNWFKGIPDWFNINVWRPIGNFFITVINGVISGFESFINFFANTFNTITAAVSTVWTWTGLSAIPEIPTVSLSRIPALATGAYDIPVGQLFVANENGPELVGSMNGKSTVANNQQIVEGIKEGVYDAVVSAMGQNNNNGNIDVKVYLDGKQIVASINKTKKGNGAVIATNGIVYGY